MGRCSTITRNTKETKITATLELDGSGKADLKTGIGFFDHMMEGFARHGFFDTVLTIEGDQEVDNHHSVEDAGIVLGQAIREAVGDKIGMKRYGSCILPMDETLCMCAIDLCNRPYFSFDYEFTTERVGELETELVREFFYAISYSAGMNLHIRILDGVNQHHIIEAIFKSFARALDEATQIDSRLTEVLSTKGSI
ncbi:MAG: imidazoleglycerol-phosphate dehydratase HisB [Eubacteriales bacterium]